MNTQVQDTRNVSITPATDIIEEESRYVLQSDLPGVDKEHLNVSVENNILEIEGKTNNELFNLHNSEKSPEYTYRRTFTLNQDIDSTNISAHLENGVLTVELAKSEAVKPRKIEVASA